MLKAKTVSAEIPPASLSPPPLVESWPPCWTSTRTERSFKATWVFFFLNHDFLYLTLLVTSSEKGRRSREPGGWSMRAPNSLSYWGPPRRPSDRGWGAEAGAGGRGEGRRQSQMHGWYGEGLACYCSGKAIPEKKSKVQGNRARYIFYS